MVRRCRRVSVEKARYDDMALPAFFVERMIQIVAARQPEKYDTSCARLAALTPEVSPILREGVV